MLLANSDAVVESTGLFPPYFGVMLLALAIVFALALVLNLLAFRVIDWITPGNLSKEILGDSAQGKQPNIALAVIVAAMFLGLSIVLGCTVIGVMGH